MEAPTTVTITGVAMVEDHQSMTDTKQLKLKNHLL